MVSTGVAGCVIMLTFVATAGDTREAGVQPPSAATADKVLLNLDQSHPRLILKDQDLAALRKLMATDELLQKCRDDVLRQADELCRRPPVAYKLDGPRLLSVCSDCVRRVYTLGLAWRLTGKPEYAEKVKENLLAACEFKNWNPSHFLDVAEMSHAFGIGYDWCFGYFDEPTRQKIRAGLIQKGLQEGVADYEDKGSGMKFYKAHFNWNQVCNGGLVIGALAIAETDPEYARKIVPPAVASFPLALANYDPDGAWPEGPSYWNYGTVYTAYGLAAMKSALGTDFGLSRRASLAQTGLFRLMISGPTGVDFNFADAGQDERRGLMPCLFWLARQYDAPALAAAERDLLANERAGALDFIWYQPRGKEPPGAALPLDRLFRGPVEIAVFRSAWNDPNALFLAVKAGYNQVNHSHLDLGSFVLDALGVRWARDLGYDDYDLPGYWDMGPEAKRWTYYRISSLSHNVPVLGGRNQDVFATTKFTKFQGGKADGGLAVLDLTSAYAGLAKDVRRGLAVIDNRRAVLVQDEFEIENPCDVAWGLTTDAGIAVDGPRAVLSRDGKKCAVTLLSPENAAFTVESARQEPPQAENKGVNRLLVRLKQQKDGLRIAVLICPEWPDGPAVKPPKLLPLKEW